MEDKKEPTHYNIDSFDKLCNVVTAENSQRLAIDLAQWLIYYAQTIHNVKLKHPKETKGKKNTKIAKGSFHWVDDGKNDLLYATVEEAETGKITTVQMQPNSEQNVQVSDTTGDDSSTDDQNKK